MFMEDDEIFGGTPEKKYYDILFTANRNLVQNELNENLDRIAAMEMLLEEMMGEEKDLEKILFNYMINNRDAIDERRMNLYIVGMGNIVTRNE